MCSSVLPGIDSSEIERYNHSDDKSLFGLGINKQIK